MKKYLLFYLVLPILFFAQSQTIVYEYTGVINTFTVPNGVTELEVKLWGAGGGGANGNGAGGAGAFVHARIPVTAASNVIIQVGGKGTYGTGNTVGGYAGGGQGGANAGSGGGYSAIFVGASISTGNARAIAGGGGGAGRYGDSYGGAGGGTDAGNYNNTRTGGKTPTGVNNNGVAGSNDGSGTGAAGASLQGGNGATGYNNGGGGGGGGYRGGGGGYGSNSGNFLSTGGGGGLSWVNTNTTLIQSVIASVSNSNQGSNPPQIGDTDYKAGVGRGGAANGDGGNGLVVIKYILPNCSGTPTGGTTVLNPNTGSASSSFLASVTGGTGALGLAYQWQINYTSSTTTGWQDIAGETEATANLTAEELAPGTVVYYRRMIRCTNSNEIAYSTRVAFTISSPSYCSPSNTIRNDYYIQSVGFLGTLNDTVNESTFGNTGYQNFTNLPNPAVQEQGAGVNITVRSNRESGMKAWIDWNQNGTFDSTEEVYNTNSILVKYTTFGFTIPVNQAPGYYRIRIRTASSTTNLGACSNLSNAGETEDYYFRVVASCDSKITNIAVAPVCGVNKESQTIFTFSTLNATQVRIYDDINATQYIALATVDSNSPVGARTFTWTANVNQDKTFYVVANNASCTSKQKHKIIAKFKMTPEIVFNNQTSDFCGDNTGGQSIKFGASGDRVTVDLIDENFNQGLGSFTNVVAGVNNNLTNWLHRTSVYIPGNQYIVLKPAIASGLANDGFALMNTTTATGDSTNRLNRLMSTGSYDTRDFINLKLDYKVFAFFEGIVPQEEYLSVEVSTNNGASWTEIKRYTSNTGIPNKWVEESLDMNAYRNFSNIKLRFSASGHSSVNYSAVLAGIDAIHLYGDKPLASSFTWVQSPTNENILYNSDCTTEYIPGTLATEICLKPNNTALENRLNWTITATATLNNACTVSGKLVIENNNKKWVPSGTLASNIWDRANGWRPAGVPDETKCVLIPTEPILNRVLTVNIPNANAKVIKVENGGRLIITDGNALTIQEQIINLGDGTNFTVENDGNLLQVNNVSNTGNIMVKRNTSMKKNDYTYWGSPVEGQNLRAFSAGKLYTYNEWDDYFTLLNGTENFDSKAKGYAIQAGPAHQSGISTAFNGVFLGKPKNGTISMPLERVGRGYNLIGNPYPSNIDFTKLYEANSDLIYNTAYFWTNLNHNPESQGSNYPNGRTINNYAILNGTGGVPATNSKVPSTVTNSSQIPNEFIKVGQGFIVRKKVAGDGDMIFNNAMRSNDNTGHFFRKKPRDRYWLELKTPLNIYTTLLVGYIENATNDFEIDYDATLMAVGSDAFYSVLGTRKLGIQGKASFVNTDVVALGTSHHENGEYTISAPTREGIFASSQSIYLKDKQTGITTDLTKGDYTFTANKGLSEGRFEIVYQPDATLDVVDSGVSSEEVQVYRDGDHFIAKSKTSKIMKIQLFNMLGQYLISVSPELKEYKWSHQLLNNGVYVVNIQLENGTTLTRKIRK